MKKNYMKNFDRSARKVMEVLISDRFIYKNGRQIDDGSIDVNESTSSIWT